MQSIYPPKDPAMMRVKKKEKKKLVPELAVTAVVSQKNQKKMTLANPCPQMKPTRDICIESRSKPMQVKKRRNAFG
jgi:hypothetical protein